MYAALFWFPFGFATGIAPTGIAHAQYALQLTSAVLRNWTEATPKSVQEGRVHEVC